MKKLRERESERERERESERERERDGNKRATMIVFTMMELNIGRIEQR